MPKMNRPLSILLCCVAATSCSVAQVPAGKTEISSIREQYLCDSGRVKIKFTIMNASPTPVVELRDLLPWSESEGGAELKLVDDDGETVLFKPQRRPIDPTDIVTLPPGESSGILDVDKLVPGHDRAVQERGNVLLQWDYVYGPKGSTILTTHALLLSKEGVDHCYSGARK